MSHRRWHLYQVFMLVAALGIVLLSATTIAYASNSGVQLVIPSLHIQASVVDIGLKQFSNGSVSWDTAQLGRKVGHLEGTGWFDAPGNIVLAAHSELAQRKPGIFAQLDQVKTGDIILVTQGDSTRQYVVAQVYLTDPHDLSALYPTSDERLTLITCDSSSYDPKTQSYGRRVIVVATRSV